MSTMVVLTVKNLTLPFGSPNEIRFLTLFSFRGIGQLAVATASKDSIQGCC